MLPLNSRFGHFCAKMLRIIAEPFGIRFADQQIGKSVNFLDLTLSLDPNNQIQYRLFRKETDARNYLRTDSYHPHQVFDSVAFSQMIRIIERNSQDHTSAEDLNVLKEDLTRCGYNSDKLEEIEPKAVLGALENTEGANRATESKKQDSLVFSIQHSRDNIKLKKLIRDLEPDIKKICEDIRIIFAIRKHPSIGNRIVKNRQLGKHHPQILLRKHHKSAMVLDAKPVRCCLTSTQRILSVAWNYNLTGFSRARTNT